MEQSFAFFFVFDVTRGSQVKNFHSQYCDNAAMFKIAS